MAHSRFEILNGFPKHIIIEELQAADFRQEPSFESASDRGTTAHITRTRHCLINYEWVKLPNGVADKVHGSTSRV